MLLEKPKNEDIHMKEAKPKREYVRYTVQDKVRFFDLKIEKCMTASAAAKQLDIHPRTAYRWASHAEDDTNDEDIDTELLDPSCISFVPLCDEDRLLIHGFDATDAFYKLQLSVLIHKWKHSLEDHTHYALATNSILFLSPNQCPDDLLPFFNEHNLKATIDHVEAIYDIKKPPMPTNIVMEIIQVTQDLIANKITREMAVIKLFKLDLATNEYKLAKAVAELARKLPRVSLAEESNEMVLRFRSYFISTKLQPYLWNFILSDIPNLDEDHTPDQLAQQYCSHPLWKKFNASNYRQLAKNNRNQSKIKLPSSRLRLFWNSSMLLQARAVWYRTLNYKLPTMSYLHSIRVVASAQCRLCEDAEDTLQHFLILCPLKLPIWLSIFQHFFPGHHIEREHIWNLIKSLEPPPSITRPHYQQLITITSTSLWHMWSSYWQTVFQDVPFLTADISAKIISQVSILQNSHSMLN
ncbi:hypothetical protein G6F22_007378 [Rhizopus arrhizus]|nr:hypothetical protein G6F22_007378 [Rhizopus arrhizus]KAG0828158.1 hypothetical protein G6F18_009215 [Rhizopus arrhizus]KAG0838561.1 hypothetical protein G6F19_003070 [Rhizopus arrhizus]KAG1398354.1 hypothetical protein G6F60_008426 [Rhizopus arrhizus]